eukprot:5432983-Amphidinium_carterae.2
MSVAMCDCIVGAIALWGSNQVLDPWSGGLRRLVLCLILNRDCASTDPHPWIAQCRKDLDSSISTSRAKHVT